MSDAKIFQLVRRVIVFISNNPFCFCVILGAAYFLYCLVSNGLVYGADTSNKIAGIFTPLLVAVVTIYLSNRQHNIADAQREVAEESKNIAATNRDIADKKMKLELFEKRYELYHKFTKMYLEYTKYYDFAAVFNNNNIDFQDTNTKVNYLEKHKKLQDNLTTIYNDMLTEINKISFLFDEECHDYCLITIKSIEKMLDSVRILSQNWATILFAPDYMEYDQEISEKFLKAKEILKPYMSLKEIA